MRNCVQSRVRVSHAKLSACLFERGCRWVSHVKLSLTPHRRGSRLGGSSGERWLPAFEVLGQRFCNENAQRFSPRTWHQGVVQPVTQSGVPQLAVTNSAAVTVGGKSDVDVSREVPAVSGQLCLGLRARFRMRNLA